MIHVPLRTVVQPRSALAQVARLEDGYAVPTDQVRGASSRSSTLDRDVAPAAPETMQCAGSPAFTS